MASSWRVPVGATAVVVVVCGVLRLLYLDADFDPSLTWSNARISDEGWKSSNALKKVIMDQWLCRTTNWLLMLPVVQLIQWPILEALGVSLTAARLPAAVLSAASLLVCAALVWVSYRRDTLLLWMGATFVFVLGVDYYFFSYGRVAFYEGPMMFFGLSSLLCLAVTCRRMDAEMPWGRYAAGTSALLTLTLLSKTTGVVYVLAAGGAVGLEAYFRGTLSWKKLAMVLAAGTLAVWIAWTLPDLLKSLFETEKGHDASGWADSRGKEVELGFYFKFLNNPIFKHQEVLFPLSVFGFFVTLLRSVRRQHAPYIDSMMLALYVAAFFFQASFSYQPPRYVLPVLVPMCFFAASAPYLVALEVRRISEARWLAWPAAGVALWLLVVGVETNVDSLSRYFRTLSYTQVETARDIREIIVRHSGSRDTPIYGRMATTVAIANGMPFRLGKPPKHERPAYQLLQSRRPKRGKHWKVLGRWNIVRPHKGRHLRLYYVE